MDALPLVLLSLRLLNVGELAFLHLNLALHATAPGVLAYQRRGRVGIHDCFRVCRLGAELQWIQSPKALGVADGSQTRFAIGGKARQHFIATLDIERGYSHEIAALDALGDEHPGRPLCALQAVRRGIAEVEDQEEGAMR